MFYFKQHLLLNPNVMADKTLQEYFLYEALPVVQRIPFHSGLTRKIFLSKATKSRGLKFGMLHCLVDFYLVCTHNVSCVTIVPIQGVMFYIEI